MKYLNPSSSPPGSLGVGGELQLSAQVVMHRLMENQHPLFAATGKERPILEVLLSSISALSSPSSGAIGGSAGVVAKKTTLQANESILFAWSSLADPILGYPPLSLYFHHFSMLCWSNSSGA